MAANYAKRHVQFISRTVLVQNGQAEQAFRVLNRFIHGWRDLNDNRLLKRQPCNADKQVILLGQEGILDTYRRTRRYEKPYQVRRRVNFEKCKAVYTEDMTRKVELIMRKNRVNPWLGYC